MARHVQLSLRNLKALDYGIVDEHFKQHLERAVKDLEARPGDETPRKVNIAFLLKPSCQPGTATLDKATVEVEVTSAVPKHRTRPYDMVVKHDGSLAFHPDLPDDPDGSTLWDEQAEKENA